MTSPGKSDGVTTLGDVMKFGLTFSSRSRTPLYSCQFYAKLSIFGGFIEEGSFALLHLIIGVVKNTPVCLQNAYFIRDLPADGKECP